MLGGIDGVSISSLVGSLGKESKGLGESGLFLQLESTLADPIKVVGVLTLIKMVTLTGAGPRTAARDILFTLITSILIGIGSGITWGQVITRLRDRPLNYMMTIAALFPVYILSDFISGGGGGPISVFLFGAVLMNYGYVTKSLKMNRRSRIDRRKIKEYHDEITFLIKAMFFVYLGLMVQFEPSFIAISILLSVLIILVRYLTASMIGVVQGFPTEQIVYSRFIFIQGAGSLVLTQFVAKYDPSGAYLANPSAFTSIVIPVVLLSIVFSSIIAPLMASKKVTVKPPEEPVETEPKKVEEAPENNKKEKPNGNKAEEKGRS
jgi:NhaP-type Na+/H+ or K+/H+ antiporter